MRTMQYHVSMELAQPMAKNDIYLIKLLDITIVQQCVTTYSTIQIIYIYIVLRDLYFISVEYYLNYILRILNNY